MRKSFCCKNNTLLNITTFLICALLLGACHQKETPASNAKSLQAGPDDIITLREWGSAPDSPAIFYSQTQSSNAIFFLTFNASIQYYDTLDCETSPHTVTTDCDKIPGIPNACHSECAGYCVFDWLRMTCHANHAKSYRMVFIKNVNCTSPSQSCSVQNSSTIPESTCYKC